MAVPADLRAWIALLEREGELVRVSAEVDADLEITEINDRVVKAGGRSEERRVGKESRYRCEWSSDVSSSDLDRAARARGRPCSRLRRGRRGPRDNRDQRSRRQGGREVGRASCRERE